jgi:hypothetical protein
MNELVAFALSTALTNFAPSNLPPTKALPELSQNVLGGLVEHPQNLELSQLTITDTCEFNLITPGEGGNPDTIIPFTGIAITHLTETTSITITPDNPDTVENEETIWPYNAFCEVPTNISLTYGSIQPITVAVFTPINSRVNVEALVVYDEINDKTFFLFEIPWEE